MPVAPVRVVVPVAIETPPVDPPKPPAPASAPAQSRPVTTPAPPPVTPPAGTTPPPEPAPILQTSPNATETERRVRTTMLKAQGDLGRIDYKRLNQDAKAQFDQAKRFIDQAEGALKVKNFVYAEQLADKAASLAALLVKSLIPISS